MTFNLVGQSYNAMTVRLSHTQWQKILPFLPTCPNIYIGQERECREFLEAILWIAGSVAQWRLLPAEYVNWNTVYKRFARWRVDKFIEFLELCVLAEREILPSNEDYFVVEAETDVGLAGISECSYYSQLLEELVEIACEHFKPAGFRYDYNDGCCDGASGYSSSSESVSVSLAKAGGAPAREKILGMVQLREKLARMEVGAEKIERLTAF